MFLSADRSIYALTTMTWEGVFANGPSLLTDYMTQYDFEGTEFRFSNPSGPDCVVTLILPTPTPSPTVDVRRPTNTATWTPDCASSEIQVRFVEFRTFGIVVLEVENRRNAVAPMTDFQFNWIQRAAGIMTLEALYVGGSGPADTVTPTVKVWQSGSTTQDANPPTTGGSTSVTQGQREGTWLTNYTFPPNSLTRMYIDFGGTAMTVQSQFGVQKSDFNGSWFQIGCGSTGGGGGGGGGSSSGRINLFNEATPAPTNTPGPTNTPRPTNTPGPTSTPAPPTNTPRPPTITNTPRPTNTPAPSPTNTPIPLPTKPGSGGADG
jgi:cell division septation protein DedD